MAEDHNSCMSLDQETYLKILKSVGIIDKKSNCHLGYIYIISMDKNHRRHTISAKGCLPYGASCSTYWKIGDDSWLLDSLPSLEKPWSVQIFSAKHWVVIPMDLSFSVGLLTSLLVSGALSSSLSSLNRLQLKQKVVSKDHNCIGKVDQKSTQQ